MCDICRMIPCDDRCPNAPERVYYGKCKRCGDPIDFGDKFYEIEGNNYCTFCVEDSLFVADRDEE